MDKKDIKLLEKQFLTDDPKSSNMRSFEEVEFALKSRKEDYSDITEERINLNFEETYEENKPLYFYDKDEAKKIYIDVDFLGIVLPSTLDYIITIGIYKAHKSENIEILKNALHTHNRLKYGSLLVSNQSYNHSGRFEQVVYAFADCDLDLVKKYLPEKFGLADKNSHKFLRASSNLIMSMLYKNNEWLSESLLLADAFKNQKSSAKSDVLAVEYLIALSQQNTEVASTLLQELANSYKKTSWLFNFKNSFLKFFGIYIHGLYHIAYFVLPEAKFKEIKTPEHTVFWNEFDEYTKQTNFTKGKLNLNLSGSLKELKILFD